jgi:hypothetical protein
MVLFTGLESGLPRQREVWKKAVKLTNIRSMLSCMIASGICLLVLM